MKDINEIKEKLNKLKDLESAITGIDFSNPKKMFETLNVNPDEIEKYYQEYAIQKVLLEYANNSENKEPEYAYGSDSGFDLRATEDVWIFAGDRKLVPTGLKFNIPENYEIQVRSKSGLALNQGLMVLNSPGTVDSGYRGEVKVILFNTSKVNIKIEKGQKIAQAVLCPVITGKWVDLVKVEEVGEKDRNDKGFGSTGL
jgi:dUTP pyrophosphatase